MKYLDNKNPNSRVFDIPKEEGGTEDDNYFGSIGDATMKHVQSLSPADRQLWEELIHVGNGALFRSTASWESVDKDQFNLKGKDLDSHLEEYRNKVSEESFNAIKEAFDLEEERRVQSEDVLDQNNTVSFNDWEQNPQMWNSVDIPQTPKNKMLYLGNTTQSFYDVFPEGHPDEKFINDTIYLMDRDWGDEEEDRSFIKWVENKIIIPGNALRTTKSFLIDMMYEIIQYKTNPTNAVEKYLKQIDDHYGKYYRKIALKKLANNDLLQLLEYNEAQWREKAKTDNTGAFAELKRFGSLVYSDKELYAKATSIFWRRYKALTEELAPKVYFKGVDLNRCSMSDLKGKLFLSRQQATDIWHARPFTSLNEAFYKGLINKKNFLTESETLNKLLNFIENKTNESIENKNMSKLNDIFKSINNLKTQNKIELSESEWQQVWTFYNLSKNYCKANINV